MSYLVQFLSATRIGANLYAVVYTEDGQSVYSAEEQEFLTFQDPEDPSATADPNFYGLTLTEGAQRTGHYVYDAEAVEGEDEDLSLNLDDGNYQIEIWEAASAPDYDRSTDTLLGSSLLAVKDGMPFNFDDIRLEFDSRNLERAVTRAGTRARRGRGGPR